MADALEAEHDLEAEVDRPHVEARVADWTRRVSDLYDRIAAMLPPGWEARRSPAPSPMHEELMREFQVAPVALDWLKLHGPAGEYWVLAPMALWVIGANGSLSLDSRDGSYIVVDRAAQFQPPDWRIAKWDLRSASEAITPTKLTDILRA